MVLFSGKSSELWIDWVGVSHGYHIHDENIAKKSFLLQENNKIEVEYLDSCGCQDVVPNGVIPCSEDEVRKMFWMIEF